MAYGGIISRENKLAFLQRQNIGDFVQRIMALRKADKETHIFLHRGDWSLSTAIILSAFSPSFKMGLDSLIEFAEQKVT